MWSSILQNGDFVCLKFLKIIIKYISLGILFSLKYFHFFSNQQDATSVATESSESSTSDLPSFEVGIRALCEVNNAEGSCIEERNVDLKNNSL